MDIFTREKLNHLSNRTGQSLISLFMPTHRVGREMQQDPIRFKNLLAQAKERLKNRGMRKSEIDALLKPASALQIDAAFWQHQSDGLVLFIAPDFMESYRLPIQFSELLMISGRFYLKPLLPLLSKNGRFYILALSQKQIRLLDGSLFNIDEVTLENVPTSLSEALWFDDPEKQLQFHTGTFAPGGASARPGVFHGQGVSNDTKTDLLRYFQQVDDGLMELFGDEQAPLVLAGVDYLLPIYRQANQYPYLIEDAILGNPDELSPEDLHQEAWKIVEPVFNVDQRRALARYQELSSSGSELASDKLESILSAAYFGRVDTLFVALGTQSWGSFDSDRNALEEHKEYYPGDQDLLDLAAVQTLSNGGTVYAFDAEEMPGGVLAAAIFRYTYVG